MYNQIGDYVKKRKFYVEKVKWLTKLKSIIIFNAKFKQFFGERVSWNCEILFSAIHFVGILLIIKSK